MAPKKQSKAEAEECARLEAEEQARQEALRREREAEEEQTRIAAERAKILKVWNDGIMQYRAAQAENRRDMLLIFEDLHASIVERQKLEAERLKKVQVEQMLSPRAAVKTPRLPALPRHHNAVLDRAACPVVAPTTPQKSPFTTSTEFRPRAGQTGKAPLTPLTNICPSSKEVQNMVANVSKSQGYSLGALPQELSIQSC
eukprot:TRINITY_DN36273_c0_g1_i1.p1 TRINITY_DN36273_c0_g1~~TRINITY_DN36273_c0_g1_i1.p1  ORF type:complete len:213 (-),score=53.88 TRINITY_DN36273_c0_g1_i1:87-686(-)